MSRRIILKLILNQGERVYAAPIMLGICPIVALFYMGNRLSVYIT
jgi:hypothetical protein